MNAGFDLSRVSAGFADPVAASQAVFRTSLEALSRPGQLVDIASSAKAPVGVHAASCALLLALLDQDTRLWISPGLAGGDAPGYFRFHTGCTLIPDPVSADFALVAGPAELPSLGVFAKGTEAYPDRSSTLVVQVDSLEAGHGWTLSGPGIRSTRCLAVDGLGEGFVTQWAQNRGGFPCGVDVFLACGTRVAGLPRTTRLEA
jgi:alpha-D-ribose 1-methylphosphonate 5-triphosphate synthase subunit PhnH